MRQLASKKIDNNLYIHSILKVVGPTQWSLFRQNINQTLSLTLFLFFSMEKEAKKWNCCEGKKG